MLAIASVSLARLLVWLKQYDRPDCTTDRPVCVRRMQEICRKLAEMPPNATSGHSPFGAAAPLADVDSPAYRCKSAVPTRELPITNNK